MAHALDHQQAGSGDLLGQRLAVREREHRVVAAVDHQRRCVDVGHRPVRTVLAAADHHPVVDHAGVRVDGALEHPAGDGADLVLVDPETAGEDALHPHVLLHDRVRVGPVDRLLTLLEEAAHTWFHRRQRCLVVRSKALLVAISVRLSTRSGKRTARSCAIPPPIETPTRCAAGMPSAVEQPQRVEREVVAGVPRLPDRPGRRLPGVAMVVADHQAAGVRERAAERRLPRLHRRCRAR